MRLEFFHLASENPYLHLVQKFWAEAWVTGYEQALRDVITGVEYPRKSHEIEEFRHSMSHRERIDMALENLTREKRQAEEAVALAMMGTKMEQLVSETNSLALLAYSRIHKT